MLISQFSLRLYYIHLHIVKTIANNIMYFNGIILQQSYSFLIYPYLAIILLQYEVTGFVDRNLTVRSINNIPHTTDAQSNSN